MEKKRRSDCFWGIHSDFHAHPNYGAVVGATLTENDVRTICENAKPDFLQIDCKGHPGYASYPTQMGNGMPMAFDTLEMWRRVTKEYGVRLYMHVSGVFDSKYCLEHPEDTAILADDKLSRSVRLNRKYLDECFIPQMCEISEKYGVDGIWVDGDCWAVACDYSPETIKRFEEKTGISLEYAPPVKKGDPYFDELLDFTREEYRNYMRYYVDKLHEKFPELEICVNWAFSDNMPEPVCANVDFLSGDLDPNKGVDSSRYAGRMLALQGKPWDLMSWGFRYNVYGTRITPPKHPIQLMQEAAAIIALGGSYQIDVLQFSDGSPDVDRILMDAPLAEFMHERRPYCHGGKIIDQAVMLVPTYDRYKEMTRPFTREGKDKFFGLTALLCDSGESLSIVNETILKEKIDGYPLVILPELYSDQMEDEIIELLRSYVLNGGSLMVVGTKTAKILADAGFPYKTEEYREHPYIPGWAYGTATPVKRQFPFGKIPAYVSFEGGADYGVTIGAFSIEAENATVLARLHPSLQNKDGSPMAVVIPYGKGKLGVIGADLGTQYYERVQYQHRDLIRRMTSMLYDPIAKVESAEGIAEIVCLSVDGKLMLQVLNAGGSHRDIGMSTENYIPPLCNAVISIRGDISVDEVVLQPENVKLDIYKEGSRTCFKIPRVDIHSIACISVK